MSSTKTIQLIHELIKELRLVSTNSVMYSQATANKAGLNSTDMESLDLLLIKGPLTAGKLSEFTGLSTGAITALIDRLEKAGYVQREHGKVDRRQVLVVPNEEKISAELAPITAPLGIAVGALLQGYSEKELDVILDFLSKANQIVAQEITILRET
jgi:DNA-binding MarR family transcriptional regulator